MSAEDVSKTFPGLATSAFAITSPATPQYNCIAWAVGDNTRFWWPARSGYWPEGLERLETVEAFCAMLAAHGYQECASDALEPDSEKVALFVNARGMPTHAARQLRSGMWTSKLGQHVDIAHELRGLEGKVYGRVQLVFSRPRAGTP
ncbi:MAG: hypothetical protein IT359_13310 [Gemmatimonadaceae bacterium]|nr:hypothetical protein [Gemmatimonadaceae bacterium]